MKFLLALVGAVPPLTPTRDTITTDKSSSYTSAEVVFQAS